MTTLTCDKLCSFLETGQDEIADDVKARKQEYTDLQETPKDFMHLQLALWIFIAIRLICVLHGTADEQHGAKMFLREHQVLSVQMSTR